MRWIVGTINKHIIQDSNGDYVATAKTAELAEAIVYDHNEMELADQYAEESIKRLLGEDSELRKALNVVVSPDKFNPKPSTIYFDMVQVEKTNTAVDSYRHPIQTVAKQIIEKGWTNKL